MTSSTRYLVHLGAPPPRLRPEHHHSDLPPTAGPSNNRAKRIGSTRHPTALSTSGPTRVRIRRPARRPDRPTDRLGALLTMPVRWRQGRPVRLRARIPGRAYRGMTARVSSPILIGQSAVQEDEGGGGASLDVCIPLRGGEASGRHHSCLTQQALRSHHDRHPQ